MSSFDMVAYLEANFEDFGGACWLLMGKIHICRSISWCCQLCFFYIFEPVYNVVCVLPLLHVRFSSHLAIDIFNNLFVHFAQFRFAWADKPACWFVPEVFFGIFECNERFSLGCYIYFIPEFESFCYVFILCCTLPDCSFI